MSDAADVDLSEPSELGRYLDTHHPGIMAQVVRSSRGRAWVELVVDLGPAERIRGRAALIASAAAPIGAIALRGGRAVLKHNHPLIGLQSTALTRSIAALEAAATALQSPAAGVFR